MLGAACHSRATRVLLHAVVDGSAWDQSDVPQSTDHGAAVTFSFHEQDTENNKGTTTEKSAAMSIRVRR